MREIKFRAYHPEWDKMVYSSGDHDWFAKREFYPLRFDVGFSYYPKDDKWIIMQYTGLHDKNGKESYEGDILLSSGGIKGIVKFADGQFIVDFRDGGGNIVYSLRDRIQWGSEHLVDEVIGDIYENPELLKECK